MLGVLPSSIQKAMSIDPAPGTTYLDAEHVVILMQENRSFDHSYGRLQGVRGFNDPRAISLPDKNKVWLQTDPKGDTYAPFRLNIRDTKSTWMHDLPHSRESQLDAYNGGKYDQWLASKKSSRQEYSDLPLTMGYYDRQDIPFYYALADAFTVCDQNFCSSMTPTHPNRYYLWSGTIRERPSMDALAVVRNSYFSINNPVKWKTFPERMEEAGISWAFYQNEISAVMQFNQGLGSWLGNFGCNPLERFAQYQVKFSERYTHFVRKEADTLEADIEKLKKELSAAQNGEEKEKLSKSIRTKGLQLEKHREELRQYSRENFRKLSPLAQGIHRRAFVSNSADPGYLELASLSYREDGEQRTVEVPASDVFYQFRKDVNEGKLPAVSYLTAPQNFSDHPSAPWYGAWYVSEILDILTRNPEVWKKTIFILCYDENDGYYDHIPPFSIPDPLRGESGKVSDGIDTRVEYVPLEQDRSQVSEKNARGGPIGLGFRVPLVVASPWSRGGKVCSQVFDHTSIIRFLEEFTSHKAKKEIRETNISEWRRTVCGSISTVFRPFDPSAYRKPVPVKRDEQIEMIHKARYKDIPRGFKALSAGEIDQVNRDPAGSSLMPRQEPGTRTACPLPYELYADSRLDAGRSRIGIRLTAGQAFFKTKSAGAPFIVYTMTPYRQEILNVRNYAVRAGDTIEDTWDLSGFEQQRYHLRIYGPNGFFREFTGGGQDPGLDIDVRCATAKNGLPTGDLEIVAGNRENSSMVIRISDNAYGQKTREVTIPAHQTRHILIPLQQSHHWYDFSIDTGKQGTLKRYAGHVETGKESKTDPLMGRS